MKHTRFDGLLDAVLEKWGGWGQSESGSRSVGQGVEGLRGPGSHRMTDQGRAEQ
jgi:hypothetical protein